MTEHGALRWVEEYQRTHEGDFELIRARTAVGQEWIAKWQGPHSTTMREGPNLCHVLYELRQDLEPNWNPRLEP